MTDTLAETEPMPNREVSLLNPFRLFNQQRTLFQFGSPAHTYAGHCYSGIAGQFRAKGHVVCSQVRTVQDAYTITMEVVSRLSKTEPYASLRYGDYLIAKADRIPVCEQFVRGGFQCLHFDYGLPVLPRTNQTLYAVTALFMPPTVASSSSITRIVPLSRLADTSVARKSPVFVDRLKEYAARHGDGWREPALVNTGRISIFLRFLDAISPEPRFSGHIDVDSATFIRKCGLPCESDLEQWQRESELLTEFGVDLAKTEHHIVLSPGDLLIFDNLTNVHGRFGRRANREIWQMLLGLPDADHELLQRMMNYVKSQFLIA